MILLLFLDAVSIKKRRRKKGEGGIISIERFYAKNFFFFSKWVSNNTLDVIKTFLFLIYRYIQDPTT